MRGAWPVSAARRAVCGGLRGSPMTLRIFSTFFFKIAPTVPATAPEDISQAGI
jgi:hypothetical protein